jgi:hypothetical protein
MPARGYHGDAFIAALLAHLEARRTRELDVPPVKT